MFHFLFLWFKQVLFFSKNIFRSSSLFSLLSLILAVAFLTVALFVVNGFSSSLQKSLMDINGHIMIVSDKALPKTHFLNLLHEHNSKIKKKNIFLSFEGLLLKSQQFKGVMFEGVSFKNLPSVFKNRILKGSVPKKKKGLIVGQALAQELELEIGSSLQAIIPSQDSTLRKRSQKLPVLAIMDFGRYDLNSRYVFIPLSLGQKLSNQFRKVSGVRMWLKKESQTDSLISTIRHNMPENYQIFSWKELERAFFKMIEMDKKIIFFVLLLLILVAGFNVSSSLFVTVFEKTKEISILKAMGASSSLLFSIFLLQGLVIGIIGSLLGIFLGTGIFFSLIELQKKWVFIPEDIYKVNPIHTEWYYGDFVILIAVTLCITLLASFLPARRACLLDVKSGLNYE